MITRQAGLQWLVKLSAPLVWRSQKRTAQKLMNFSATEAGSALDMLAAAEITDDAGLRRLFFQHAMDEARHALLFKNAAKQVDPDNRGGTYDLQHATRQNLLQKNGLLRFMAFVHLSERDGQQQFEALAEHFVDDTTLHTLFARLAKEERFHVTYSFNALQQFSASDARFALLSVKASRAWAAWRRAGRVLGDLAAHGIAALLYVTVIPIFALLSRVLEPNRTGWQTPPSDEKHPERQF